MEDYKAIRYIEYHGHIDDEVKDIAIKAIKELHKYEAIGTIEELQDLKSRLRSYKDQMSIYAEQHKVILASDVLEALEELER